jgi:Ca2+-binding RTX toxin-like protein
MTAHRKTRPSLKIESLEQRAMMAANLTANLSDGVLAITGTDGADTILVRQSSDQIRVDGVVESFSAASVKAVLIDAKAGDDYVSLEVNGQLLAKPSLIDAGSGNDHVRGGSGSDAIYLGAGDDIAVTHAGNDTVYGGDGNDRVWSGDGNDKVTGEAGNDEIVLGSGDDLAFGGAGNDKFWGEAGQDRLDGGAGDDMLVGGNGTNQLFGGAGDDSLYGDQLIDRLDYSGATSASMTSLDQGALERAIDAAIERWNEAGVSAGSVALMQAIDFRVADLPDTVLGFTARRDANSATIWVDEDGAGDGWFQDASPADDAEFGQSVAGNIWLAEANSSQAAQNDLLTVIAHAMGQSLGLGQTDYLSTMTTSLPTGVRLMPTQALVADVALSTNAAAFSALTSFRPRTSTGEFAQQLSQNGLSPRVADYFATYLGNVQQQETSSILFPTGPASATQRTVPLGNTGLLQRPTEQSEWQNPDAVISQGLAIALLAGPDAAASYINYMVSQDSVRDLLVDNGYGHIAELTATSADSQRIVNDPLIAQISGQWIHNATVDYITDTYGMGGVHNTNWQAVANDFGINSGHLTQLFSLPGMQPSRPAGTGTGSPFIDMMGAPIGSNPVDRYTYNGSQPYNGGYVSTTTVTPSNYYGGYQTYVNPQSYGLPYNSSGVFTPTASMYSYGNVYANPWNW